MIKGMTRLGNKQVIKSVRIVTLSDVPPGYFLRPKVVHAIQGEVKADMIKRDLKRAPSGVEATWRRANLLDKFKSWIRRK